MAHSWRISIVRTDVSFAHSGLYAIVIDGMSETPASDETARTNWFEIRGGDPEKVRFFTPGRIAGVVISSVAGLVLLVAAVVWLPRFIRSRRSVAVNLE